MNKQELRILLKERRNALSQSNKNFCEGKIHLKIQELIKKTCVSKVGGYYPIHSEVNILPALFSLGVEISLPYIDTDLKFSVFDKNSKLVNSDFSLVPEIIIETTPELIFVPLLGFDEELNRIGYGKGFYDKYIIKNPQIKFIGIAFGIQKCENIPTNEHDQKLDGVITEF